MKFITYWIALVMCIVVQQILAMSQCEMERKLSKSFFRRDTYTLECNKDGSYKPRQCFIHLHYGKQCWCVDKYGQEILGTRRIDSSHPDCRKEYQEFGDTNDDTSDGENDMEREDRMTDIDEMDEDVLFNRNSYLSDGKRITKCQSDQLRSVDDMFKPDCNKDGSYKAIQCYEKVSIGKWCWCVDEDGFEIIGSKVEITDNVGNLVVEKCDRLRKQNTSNNYWTAFYRRSQF